MKKLKLILASLFLVVFVTSCDKDGGDSVIATDNGGAPNIKKVATADQSINLAALNNGDDINLSFTVDIARGDVASMDIVGIYKQGTTVQKAVLKAGVTTFPSTITLTKTDLFSAFDAIPTAGDITVSDKLIISADVTLKDGRVYKLFTDDGTPRFGADIANSQQFSVSQTYIISCPLDDASTFNGNYSVTQDTWQDYGIGDIVPVEYDSTLGVLSFKILSANNPYIANPSTSYMLVTIDPTDSSVTVQSNEDFDYGGGFIVPVTGTGAVGSCTGDISLTLSFGPYGPYYFDLVKN
ncbi:hypothetical protein [Flavobacterium phycosphaerae]|uniref:hypothetical protein n=1 Tax=Flavobacterium phycosphaerae TaxID=2697515 RepID=UPI00138974E0|nr:hypothetical protein [Flavobacterium phycosphaerae]